MRRPQRMGLWRSPPQSRRSFIFTRQQHYSVVCEQPLRKFAIPTPDIDQEAILRDVSIAGVEVSYAMLFIRHKPTRGIWSPETWR